MKEKLKGNREETLIDPNKVFSALGRKIWVILLAAVLCGAIILAGMLFAVTPKYEAAVKLYVNNHAVLGESISSGDLSTSRDLTDSCIVILNTRETLNAVIDYTGADCSCTELKAMISAEAIDGTEILEVTVRAADPQAAEKLANAIADILPQRVVDIIEGASVKVVEAAVLPDSPSSPNYVENTAIAALAGAFLAAVVIALREIFNTPVRTKE